MLRQLVVALSALTLPLGAVVLNSATAAATVRPHKTITFTGSVSCKITGGHITMTPPLALVTAKSTVVKIAGKATGCTGSTSQGGATIVSGKISGSVTATTDCADLASGVPNPVGSITWTTTGNLAKPTKFSLSKGKAALGSKSISITFSSAQTGSFAGTGSAKATVDKTESQLITACESATGLKSLAIASGSFS